MLLGSANFKRLWEQTNENKKIMQILGECRRHVIVYIGKM